MDRSIPAKAPAAAKMPAALPLRRAALSSLTGLLLIMLAGAFTASLALGAVAIPPGEILRLLMYKLGGLIGMTEAHGGLASGLGSELSSELSRGLGSELSSGQTEAIIWHIRLPRSVAAVISGAALALSGAAVQGMFRNPMASPNILGISAGSSFAAVLVIVTGMQIIHPLILPLAAFCGAMLTAAFVYFIGSNRGRSHLLFIILAGLGLSSLFGGLVSALLLFSSRYEVSQFLFWTMGGLDGLVPERLLWSLPIIIPAAVILLRKGRTLNLLSLGDEQAHSLGLRVERSKAHILLLTALITSMSIALSGPIAFIGLMVPHFMRLIFGSDHRRLLPLSALGGAVFLLLCDIIGRRLIPPYEIKTGIITAIVGAPYILFLIVRYQRRGGIV
ncbi:MAG: FecCD family ABC transporter permease [Salinispira sp.]